VSYKRRQISLLRKKRSILFPGVAVEDLEDPLVEEYREPQRDTTKVRTKIDKYTE